MASEVTERVVRDRLLRLYPPHEALIAFNLCGIGPYTHEMDMVRVLPSGWAYEFEIKVTASDIKAEGRKLAKHSELQLGCVKWRYLHPLEVKKPDAEIIASNDPFPGQVGALYIDRTGRGSKLCGHIERPIKQFYVVVPTDELAVVAVAHTPAWAGVAVISSRHTWSEARKAKTLPHSRKVNDEERAHILKRVYTRFWQIYFERGGQGRK